MIDTGDTVRHKPTGEKWIVAYVRDDRLAWIGWPEGEANLSDCTLIEKCSEEKRQYWLTELARIPNNYDARKRYAYYRLHGEPAPG